MAVEAVERLSSDRLQRRRFVSMAVLIECLLETRSPQERLFDEVEREFERFEAMFSRFRPDSELSALNRAVRRRCSPEMVEVVSLAVSARERTGGRFDPTVHDALVAAGYDRTFSQLAPDGKRTPQAHACGGEIVVHGDVISLGAGIHIDLGGLVKGWAAERACELLAGAGPCLVNAGGDLAVRGVPTDGVWPIAVETPTGPITLGLRHGGLATSGRDYRRWHRSGHECHHLIDPATGLPSSTDLVRVTVVAADAVEAEIWATALILAGRDDARIEADRRRLPALLIDDTGSITTAGELA
jgi:thiamine biosynthesis lipoprotein